MGVSPCFSSLLAINNLKGPNTRISSSDRLPAWGMGRYPGRSKNLAADYYVGPSMFPAAVRPNEVRAGVPSTGGGEARQSDSLRRTSPSVSRDYALCMID